MLIVGKDDTVASRVVKLGPLVGNLRVVASGLKPQDRVVIAGIPLAAPGTKVQPQPGRIALQQQSQTIAAAEPVAAEATLATN